MELKFDGSTTKVRQIADYIGQAIAAGKYAVGENLPSINLLSKTCNVSRDTVFKAFLLLKEKKIIDSIHGKSYYVANQSLNVLLLLDEYSPFKESLYNSLVKKIPSSYKVDLWFHQYNKELFDTIISESYGHYGKYVVMNYDNEKFAPALEKIDKKRLLLIDFGKFDKDGYSFVCQDFDGGLYDALASVKNRLEKYTKLVFVRNKKHKHPESSKKYFAKFCADNGFGCEVLSEITQSDIGGGNCYVVIHQTDVVEIIKKGRARGLKMGVDFGLIAYNENPFYEVIENGIASISINFNQMGSLAADFVLTGNAVQLYLPARVFREEAI